MTRLSLRGRLLAAVVGLGLALGLATAGAAVYFDYRYQAQRTASQISQAGLSAVPAFARASWTVDNSQLDLLLDALARLPTVDYVAVIDQTGEIRARGQVPSEVLIKQEFALIHQSESGTFPLGQLVLMASRAPLRALLWQRMGWIVMENLARSLVLGAAFLVLFNHLITRRLSDLAASLARDPLALEHPPAATAAHASGSRDEIEQLGGAVEHMRAQVADAHRQLKAERDRYSAAILENPEPIWQLQFDPPVALMPPPTAAALAGAARLTEVNAAAHQYLCGPVPGSWQSLKLLPHDMFSRLLDGGRTRAELTIDLEEHNRVFRHNLTFLTDRGAITALWGISTDITTATRALAALAANESDLRESRARFLDAQRMAQLGHWSFLIPTQQFFPSAELLRIFGFTKSDRPTWQQLHERIDPADRIRLEQLLLDPADTTIHSSYSMSPAAGDTRTLEITVRKTVAGGEVVEIFGIVRDITEARRHELAREEAQRILLENERRMAKAQSIAQMGYWVLDIEAQEFSCSDELFRLFGYPPQGLDNPGSQFERQIHPDDREVVTQLRANLTQTPQSYEYRILRPDGSVRHLLGSTTPERDAEGVTQKVFGIAMDITDRKRVEAEYRASREWVSSAFEASPDGIFIVDLASGQLLMANSACTALTGGRAGSPLAQLPLEDEADSNNLQARIMSEAEATNVVVRITGREDVAAALLTWRSVAANGGAARLGMLRDISAIRMLERLNQRQRDQLAQADKLAALGTMVAGVAHEINNPNYLIALNADLLAGFTNELLELAEDSLADAPLPAVGGLSFVELTETLPELLRDIRTSSQRIDKIIRDLKEFARPQAVSAREAVRINPLLQRTLKHLPPHPSAPAIELELCDTEPMVAGDAEQLGQILLNLINNAVESGSDIICLRTSTSDDQVVIEVADRGPGVADDIKGQIFDPFFTTKRSAGGSGLGLAICHRLAREHGGTLELCDNPGGGALFRLSLPPWHPQNATRSATKFAPET